MKKVILIFASFLFFISCSSTKYKVDNKTYVSKAKNQRIQFIVLHYTAGNNKASIGELTSNRVSSHYLIVQGEDKNIYNLVPDNERAWHAGVSSFRGRSNLNDTSIGIEIVNDGIDKKYLNYHSYHPYEHYVDFEDIQIEKVIQLLGTLIEKYNIEARNVLAHSDIAPSRKTDPGAKFPWKLLSEKYNIGAWYNEEDKVFFMNDGSYEKQSVKDLKKELRKYGYTIDDTDEWNKASKDVVYAFQLHFNPYNLTGEMDLETYAILKALNKKYVQ